MQQGDLVFVLPRNSFGILYHVGDRTCLVREFVWQLPMLNALSNKATINFVDGITWVRNKDVVLCKPPTAPLEAA